MTPCRYQVMAWENILERRSVIVTGCWFFEFLIDSCWEFINIIKIIRFNFSL